MATIQNEWLICMHLYIAVSIFRNSTFGFGIFTHWFFLISLLLDSSCSKMRHNSLIFGTRNEGADVLTENTSHRTEERKKEIDFSKFRSLLRLTFQTTKISVIVFAFDTKHQNTNGRNNKIEIYNQMKM